MSSKAAFFSKKTIDRNNNLFKPPQTLTNKLINHNKIRSDSFQLNFTQSLTIFQYIPYPITSHL